MPFIQKILQAHTVARPESVSVLQGIHYERCPYETVIFCLMVVDSVMCISILSAPVMAVTSHVMTCALVRELD